MLFDLVIKCVVYQEFVRHLSSRIDDALIRLNLSLVPLDQQPKVDLGLQYQSAFLVPNLLSQALELLQIDIN